MNPTTRTQARFPLAGLLILAVATFLSVTIEMIPTGLMPDMSRDLGVSEAQIGLLLSVFAFTVVVSVVPLTLLTKRWGRRTVIIATLTVLALSTFLSGLAPTYEFLVAARFLGGLAHGLFWSVVSGYAGYLVSRADVARAVSLIVTGGTLAFVFGVPLATALGHAVGWRPAFIAIAAATSLGVILVWLFVPTVKRAAPLSRKQLKAELDALLTGEMPISRPSSWRDDTTVATLFVCLMTAFIMVGHYSFYSFITPYLIGVTGLSEGLIPVMLFVFGVAGVGGLVVSGTVFSARVTLGLRWAILGCLVGVAIMAAMSGVPALAITGFVIWGIAFGMLPPTLQTTMLRTASDQIRDTASAAYTLTFNTGIGGGALVGAILLESLGLNALPWVYGGMLLVALVASMVGIRVLVRRRASVIE